MSHDTYLMNNTAVTADGTKVKLLGHWLYVRKCIVPDIVDAATGKLLLVLPELAKDFADQMWAWVEVIGKGNKVGSRVDPTSKYAKERKARGYAMQIDDDKGVGDLIMIPLQPWKMMHSPYCASAGIEFFIDETVPIAICPQEPKEQAA